MTCSSSSFEIRVERTLYLCRSSKDKVAVDLHLVVLVDKDFINLGECWTAAKLPSGRIARHSVGFYKLRRVLDSS